MGQAINKFLQRLERQEKMGFKDLASVLSHLPKTAQGFARPGAPCLWQAMEGIGGWFCPSTGQDQAYMFTPSEYYPGISWVIPFYLVISLVNP